MALECLKEWQPIFAGMPVGYSPARAIAAYFLTIANMATRDSLLLWEKPFGEQRVGAGIWLKQLVLFHVACKKGFLL